MLKTTTYLVEQVHSVVYSPSGTTPNRNMTMYARNLKVYKGADNPIVIEIKNNDQKPVDITGKTFVFNVLDQDERKTLISRTGTTVNASKGKVKFTISESDLLNVSGQFLNYSILETTTGTRGAVFVDDQYGALGNIEVIDGPYTEFRDSKEVNLPNTNPVSVEAYPQLNQNSALHTAQLYLTNFTGKIKVEASLAPVSELDADEYFTVLEKQYTNESTNQYFNFNGVYSHVRFSKADRDDSTALSGTVDKILYRL